MRNTWWLIKRNQNTLKFKTQNLTCNVTIRYILGSSNLKSKSRKCNRIVYFDCFKCNRIVNFECSNCNRIVNFDCFKCNRVVNFDCFIQLPFCLGEQHLLQNLDLLLCIQIFKDMRKPGKSFQGVETRLGNETTYVLSKKIHKLLSLI